MFLAVYSKTLRSVKPKLKSAIGADSTTFAEVSKHANICLLISYVNTGLELQTKNAIEIRCCFQRSNIEDLYQEAGRIEDKKMTRLARTTPGYGKSKIYFDKLMDEKNDTQGARKCFFFLTSDS